MSINVLPIVLRRLNVIAATASTTSSSSPVTFSGCNQPQVTLGMCLTALATLHEDISPLVPHTEAFLTHAVSTGVPLSNETAAFFFQALAKTKCSMSAMSSAVRYIECYHARFPIMAVNSSLATLVEWLEHDNNNNNNNYNTVVYCVLERGFTLCRRSPTNIRLRDLAWFFLLVGRVHQHCPVTAKYPSDLDVLSTALVALEPQLSRKVAINIFYTMQRLSYTSPRLFACAWRCVKHSDPSFRQLTGPIAMKIIRLARSNNDNKSLSPSDVERLLKMIVSRGASSSHPVYGTTRSEVRWFLVAVSSLSSQLRDPAILFNVVARFVNLLSETTTTTPTDDNIKSLIFDAVAVARALRKLGINTSGLQQALTQTLVQLSSSDGEGTIIACLKEQAPEGSPERSLFVDAVIASLVSTTAGNDNKTTSSTTTTTATAAVAALFVSLRSSRVLVSDTSSPSSETLNLYCSAAKQWLDITSSSSSSSSPFSLSTLLDVALTTKSVLKTTRTHNDNNNNKNNDDDAELCSRVSVSPTPSGLKPILVRTRSARRAASIYEHPLPPMDLDPSARGRQSKTSSARSSSSSLLSSSSTSSSCSITRGAVSASAATTTTSTTPRGADHLHVTFSFCRRRRPSSHDEQPSKIEYFHFTATPELNRWLDGHDADGIRLMPLALVTGGVVPLSRKMLKKHIKLLDRLDVIFHEKNDNDDDDVEGDHNDDDGIEQFDDEEVFACDPLDAQEKRELLHQQHQQQQQSKKTKERRTEVE
eukprot:PhM_4_TR10472/c3_g1_i1/m.2085